MGGMHSSHVAVLEDTSGSSQFTSLWTTMAVRAARLAFSAFLEWIIEVSLETNVKVLLSLAPENMKILDIQSILRLGSLTLGCETICFFIDGAIITCICLGVVLRGMEGSDEVGGWMGGVLSH